VGAVLGLPFWQVGLFRTKEVWRSLGRCGGVWRALGWRAAEAQRAQRRLGGVGGVGGVGGRILGLLWTGKWCAIGRLFAHQKWELGVFTGKTGLIFLYLGGGGLRRSGPGCAPGVGFSGLRFEGRNDEDRTSNV